MVVFLFLFWVLLLFFLNSGFIVSFNPTYCFVGQILSIPILSLQWPWFCLFFCGWSLLLATTCNNHILCFCFKYNSIRVSKTYSSSTFKYGSTRPLVADMPPRVPELRCRPTRCFAAFCSADLPKTRWLLDGTVGWLRCLQLGAPKGSKRIAAFMWTALKSLIGQWVGWWNG